MMDGDDFCTQHSVKNHHLGHLKYLVYQCCPSPSASQNGFGLTFCCTKFQMFCSIITWQCWKMLLLQQRYFEAILKVIEQRKWGETQQHPKMRCVCTQEKTTLLLSALEENWCSRLEIIKSFTSTRKENYTGRNWDVLFRFKYD